MDDDHILSHSKWNCRYNIVFARKHRRQVIYGKIKADTGKILRQLLIVPTTAAKSRF